MNKNYFSTLICGVLATFCLISGALNAQNNHFAVQASGGISGLLENYPSEQDKDKLIAPQQSFGLAFVAERTFRNPRFGLQIEPGFVKRGYAYTGVSPFRGTPMNLFYLNAPIALLYKPYKNNRLQILMGADMGYLFQERYNGRKINPALNDIHKKFDLGGFMGIQSKIYSKLTMGVRASLSFTPVSKVDYYDDLGKALGTYNQYNFGLNLYARYYFK